MADFNIAVTLTLRHEGGFQNDYHDRGNWTSGKVGEGTLKGTKYGISAMEFPNEDIANMTEDRARQIYQAEYWLPLYTSIKDQWIANKIFDMGVLFGTAVASHVIQFVIKPHFPNVVVDGKFGETTLSAVNGSEPVSLLAAYKTAFVSRAIAAGANNPNEREDVSGWIRRINS